ncbi:CG32599, partial [Drosophila busckii]
TTTAAPATASTSSPLKYAPKITVTNTDPNGTATTTKTKPAIAKTKAICEPKSPDMTLARKSLTSMSDEEIIQENLKELMDIKSREERKANGRLVAVIVAFLVIFMTIYHAWMRNTKTKGLTGVLVPAGIMLSYGAWVVLLAKRDKRRAQFDQRIEEVVLKNKSELGEKHMRLKQEEQRESSSASSSLQIVNELTAHPEQRKKQRRNKQRHRAAAAAGTSLTADVQVHQNTVKRPSFRQKLFGQTIAHVKLVEAQCDSEDSHGSSAGSPSTKDAAQRELKDKRKRLQRLDTLAMPQVVRMSSAP